MKNIFLVSLVFLFSCQSNNQPGSNSAADSTNAKAAVISLYRDVVKPEPVAEYSEKVNNSLNDWHFSVSLYETNKTFYYRIRMQYEELRAEDTLRLPNLGAMPRPAIQKGPEKYSCILGFMDIQNKFNEYKLVHIEGRDLKITALKHYSGAVYTK